MNTKRLLTVGLSLMILVLATVFMVPIGVQAAGKVKLSKTTLTFDSPSAKAQTVKIKNVKKKNVKSISVTNVYDNIIEVQANKNKLKLTVTPKGEGTAVSVVICVRFKKPVNHDTEAYLYLENVTVKGGEDPSPGPQPEKVTAISTPAQLQAMQSYTADQTVYELANDIDMTGQEPVKGYGYGLSDFVLDGKGYTIKCDRPVFLINEGTIRNVHFDLDFQARTSDKSNPLTAFWSESYGNNIGPVMTNNAAGILENCVSTGTIDITYDEKIEQRNYDGSDTITLAIAKVGGLTGSNGCGLIKNCKSSVTIKMTFGNSDFAYVGGIAGENSGNEYLDNGVFESIFDGDIVLMDNMMASAGGISGFSSGDVRDCLNTGSVRIPDGAYANLGAGIIGIGSRSGSVERCLSTGDVDCGLYGYVVSVESLENVMPTFTDAYYLISKSDGFNYLPEAFAVPGTKGITDEELLDEATFTGFDFTNVWEMGANGPRLKNLS